MLHFINVGYGDAILIQPEGQASILIDAGPATHSKQLMAFLDNAEKIDTAILTHPHENHFGGFLKVLEKYKIKDFYFNADKREDVEIAELYKVFNRNKIKQLKAGDELEFDQLTLKILSPENLDAGVNDVSLSILIEFKNVAFLLTSDIGPKFQDKVIKKITNLDKVKIVQLPHHGDVLSESFIKSFKEKLFVLSTGENSWGLPKEQEIAKLKGQVLRTDKVGDISFFTDGKTVSIIND